MKYPERDKELLLISQTRALFDDQSKLDAIGEWYDRAAPESTKLAFMGAALDAISELPGGDEYQHKRSGSWMNKDLKVLLLAAFLRCLINPCKHVYREAGIVRHAMLAPRILSCKPCLPTFLEDIEEFERKSRGSDECDLCLKRGIMIFRKFQIAWNGSVIYGDYCEDCHALYEKSIAGGEPHA